MNVLWGFFLEHCDLNYTKDELAIYKILIFKIMNYGSLHLDIVSNQKKSYLFIKDSMMLTKYEIFAKKMFELDKSHV